MHYVWKQYKTSLHEKRWSVPVHVLSSNLSQSYIIKVGLHSDIRCPLSDCINLCPAEIYENPF